MAEADRGDLERRLRIRRRNLERLRLEANYVADNETPPAVLDRIHAQIRVESEEIRLLEGRLADLEGRGRYRPVSGGGFLNLLTHLGSWGRIGLAIVGLGVLLVVIVLVLPRSLEGVALFGLAPTYTPVPTPTNTTVPPTATSVPTSTPVPTATYTFTPEVPTPTATVASAVPRGKVNVEVLNLRSGPSTEFGIRSKLMMGEELDLAGRNELGTWLAVATQDGATGWVAAEYVDLTIMILDLPVEPVAEE